MLALFKVLTEVFRSLKIPVVVAFDQLEDLLLARRSDDAHRTAESFFAGIVQVMHQIDGLCFLIFAERGLWNRFVPSLDGYIQDRLNNPVHVPKHGTVKALRLEAPSADLVRRVVRGPVAALPGRTARRRDRSPDIFPFADEQVTRIARTEPTLRDMLQQFRHLFDHLVYGPDDQPVGRRQEEVVQETVQEVGGWRPEAVQETVPEAGGGRLEPDTDRPGAAGFGEPRPSRERGRRVPHRSGGDARDAFDHRDIQPHCCVLGQDVEEVPITFKHVDIIEAPADTPPPVERGGERTGDSVDRGHDSRSAGVGGSASGLQPPVCTPGGRGGAAGAALSGSGGTREPTADVVKPTVLSTRGAGRTCGTRSSGPPGGSSNPKAH